MADKETVESTEAKESMAKKIWLAGLGAYGQGFDDAVEQYGKVGEKTEALFAELVKKGAALEEQTLTKFEEVKSKSTTTIDERMSAVKAKLGMGEKEETRLERLEAKLDALTEVVNALSTTKAPKKAATKTSK